MKTRLTFLFITVSMFFSCAKGKMEGLWVIDSVHERSTEVKPKAYWIKFGKDDYQESGHGWQKHGIGTWDFKKHEVSVLNSNGYIGEFKEYKVKFTGDGMEWSRMEDDRKIRVFLSKAEEIPLSNRDRLLGLWDLKTALENGDDKTLAKDPRNKVYIEIKWDNTYVFDRAEEGQGSGLYRVDGNRNEIELVTTGVECKVQTWNFEVEKDRLVLMSVNQEKETILEFIRINKMPE